MNKWGSDFAIKWLTIGTNDHSCEANLYFLATYAFFESALYPSDNSRHFLGNFILVPQLTFAGRQKMRPIAQPRPAPPRHSSPPIHNYTVLTAGSRVVDSGMVMSKVGRNQSIRPQPVVHK